MGWPFCPRCRATLSVQASGAIACAVCQYASTLDELQAAGQLPTRTTYSATRPTPLWARTEEERHQQRANDTGDGNRRRQTRMTIDEPCVECQHQPVEYYTVQLRSADEGQTVFYECPACKHTWSVNN